MLDNKLMIRNNKINVASNDKFLITYDEITNELFLQINEDMPLNIESKGDINIKCKSFNVIVDDDFSVDSLKDLSIPSIFLNSRMCKKIKQFYYKLKK